MSPLAPISSSWPQLPTGRHGHDGPSRDEVARNQRGRLVSALLSALAEHDYQCLRTRELCERARLSKRDLYRHYKGGVHDCYMAAFAQVQDALVERLESAWASGNTPSQRLTLAIAAFVHVLAHDPVAARVALVEPYAAGPAATAAKRTADRTLRAMLIANFQLHGIQLAPTSVRAMFAGLGAVACSRLLAGQAAELASQTDDLTRWAWTCANAPVLPMGCDRPLTLPTYEPSKPLLAKARSCRQPERLRIMAAAVLVAAEHRPMRLTEKAIRHVAQVTRADFHAHFECPQAALMAALDFMYSEALRYAMTFGTATSWWPHRVMSTIEALMRCLATDDIFARFALTETPGGSREHCVGAPPTIVARTAGILRAATPTCSRPSTITAEASIAAAWNVVRRHAARRNQRQLPSLTPTLAFVTLAPAIGIETTMQAISTAPQLRRRLATVHRPCA